MPLLRLFEQTLHIGTTRVNLARAATLPLLGSLAQLEIFSAKAKIDINPASASLAANHNTTIQIRAPAPYLRALASVLIYDE